MRKTGANNHLLFLYFNLFPVEVTKLSKLSILLLLGFKACVRKADIGAAMI
jgi:hypothetical protein